MAVAAEPEVTGHGGPRGRRPRGRGAAVVAALSCAILLAGSGAAAATPVARAAATAGAAQVHWGKVELVPGLAALNKGDWNSNYNPPSASVNSISCWGSGGCVVGGFYTDQNEHLQAFVAMERKGRWGKAVEVPGTAALNQGGNAEVGQVSCAPTSVCVAVGTYTSKAGGQWFTVTERDGAWGKAAEVPYPALSKASIGTVWCAPGGLCAAGGTFTDSAGTTNAWVRTEVQGRWQPALEVPGLAALNTDGNGSPVSSSVDSVSCASAGNCAAGGQYVTNPPYNPPPSQAFVVTQTNGTWSKAEEVPGLDSLNGGQQAETTFMACPSAGNCTAAGSYAPNNLNTCFPDSTCYTVFVVNEKHGSWAQATGPNEFGSVSGLTCPATGDCVAAGAQVDGQGNPAGEVLSETNDHWTTPLILASTQNVDSVSCSSPGYCAAGGNGDHSGIETAFVITESKGTWGTPVSPTGLPAQYSATISAVACPPKITLCIAGGLETPANSTRSEPFIVSQTG